MRKWCRHLGQTLRFSSNSLSKTMVLHLGLGHLVQRPSGISFFFDFPPPSLGFFAKAVSLPGGGGVTAGSTVSNPSVFLVNEVVAINSSNDFILANRARLSRRKLRSLRALAKPWRRRWWWRRWSARRPPTRRASL